MKTIYLTNASGRDASVQYASLKPAPRRRMVLPGGGEVTFKRYLASAETGTHAALQAAHGDDYFQALIDGDPEVDLERVGMAIKGTSQVFLSADGEILHAAPKVVEIVYDAQGEEKERREPVDVAGNTDAESPIRWTGRRFPRADIARRFVIRRTVQLAHQDGLTYDYLFEMAKELDEADEVVLLGSGPKGRGPLVFQTNGTPHRAFLEGRIDSEGKRYQLLLRLSNMELRRPAEPPPKADTEKGGA